MTKTTCDICGAECLPYYPEDETQKPNEWCTLAMTFRHRPTVHMDLCEKCADRMIRKINESVTGI